MTLRAPFPYFGGKSRAASIVWAAFGPEIANYVEPFFGSGAVLLGRPSTPRIETINDVDAYVSNFWRAVKAAPELVAEYADWPVNEIDLHARHRWLVQRAEFREAMRADPDLYDAKIAGWWVWGICQWIGSGWCSQPENGSRPHLRTGGSGVHRRGSKQGRVRNIDNAAEWRKRPVLAHGGRGVHHLKQQIPMLAGDSGASGRGIHASAVKTRLPYLHTGAQGVQAPSRGPIVDWMIALADRLRRVRVCCGDWKRVLGPSSTDKIGETGIFFDPPYGIGAERDPSLYSHDDLEVAAAVRAWCLENGDNPRLKIALCGYEGEHDMPKSWQCIAWKAVGGYAASAGNTANAKRERIWFSPACLNARKQRDLFAAASGDL